MLTIGQTYKVTKNIGREYGDVIRITKKNNGNNYSYVTITANDESVHRGYSYNFDEGSIFGEALKPINQEPINPKANFEDLFKEV